MHGRLKHNDDIKLEVRSRSQDGKFGYRAIRQLTNSMTRRFGDKAGRFGDNIPIRWQDDSSTDNSCLYRCRFRLAHVIAVILLTDTPPPNCFFTFIRFYFLTVFTVCMFVCLIDIWLTSFDSPTPKAENPLLYAKISGISLIQAELQPILSQISLPWQRGLVVVKFVWRHSIARPRKPPPIRKYLRHISYISRVIADFIPNFVAMATGVIRGQI